MCILDWFVYDVFSLEDSYFLFLSFVVESGDQSAKPELVLGVAQVDALTDSSVGNLTHQRPSCNLIVQVC